jgi:hypothetical protein
MGDGSNFLNLKFLNFRGIRNGRKFAGSPTHTISGIMLPWAAS